MRITRRTGRHALHAAVFALAIGVAGCSPQFNNYGYVPPEEDLALIEVGNDTRESVADKVGVPTSSGVLNTSGYYYVRMRTRTIGPLAPQEIDRQVVAISFSDAGVVQNVERFGLERGQVVPLSRRVTSSPVSDNNFLRQLLGNIGRFNPTAFGS
ncbi:outer membrane protein assembly factor BamE [Sulfitobacter geojensis]|uniref:Outer membrane protein assembly factor BamE n=1 Tax=Sulfitobacter geojensis TaxID=1342299 RepID=A0AAE2VVB1_9RHOB|nr:outer membrane protein assembly factor BamE [Sulfitobacter geojensis]MBM1688050.1 outer membrane protein assembly factor BamE [Sulfitobacter geojensis]MBM1692117.1 outer membrane protein assembly factor BamE [Sulfitobacter geojensis]MBM1704283.1 outer membrane protein assembly factor BamE [Sulfitobacter geojensis]MBM1708341.1 outer membrane protein assembly factor BamE [Sulfitobacter geojensis]MBM1712406.1 outer membrane protein assembly factor BamE [Sulfitobacter geojensis]